MAIKVKVKFNGETKLANFGGKVKGTIKCPLGTFEFDNSGSTPVTSFIFEARDANDEYIYSGGGYIADTPNVGDTVIIEYSDFVSLNPGLIDALTDLGYMVDESQFPLTHTFLTADADVVIITAVAGGIVRSFNISVRDSNTSQELYNAYAEWPNMPSIGGTMYITAEDIDAYSPDIISFLDGRGKSLDAGQFPVEHTFETADSDVVDIYAQ